MADFTKTGAEVDAIQEIAQNTILEGTNVNIPDDILIALQIWCALTNTTAHTSTRIIVQVSEETSGNEFWADLVELISTPGTNVIEAITDNPLTVGSTTLTIADSAGYETDEDLPQWVFLEDISTFANSEFIYQTGFTTDTNITIIDGTARQHAQNSVLNNIVDNWIVEIPAQFRRVRVVYSNKYDSDGATVAIACRIAKVTDIE